MSTMVPVMLIRLIALTQTFLSFHGPRALRVVGQTRQLHPRYIRLLL